MSHPPPAPFIPFSKPWLDYSGQANLLESRGLVIADRVAAEDFLAHVNYYRLSGYCLAFEMGRHHFFPTTTFEQIRAAYDFDVAIRDLLNDALEVVEVDLRTATAYYFGEVHGAYGHTLTASFFHDFDHARWLNKVRKEVKRSKERFVIHFKRTYTRFPDLPVWIGTEVMSFGILSQMLSGLLRADIGKIAYRYRIKPATLTNWAHHLCYVRNLCAHHARVWDRVWSIKPALPPMTGWQPPHLSCDDRIACTLLILYRMLLRCPAIGTFAASWKTRVEQLLLNPPTAPGSLDKMGLTPPLTANPLWT